MDKNTAIEIYKLLIASLRKKWNNPEIANDIEKVLFHQMQKVPITPEFLPLLQLDQFAEEICENRRNYLGSPLDKRETISLIINLLQQFRVKWPNESIAFNLIQEWGEEFNSKMSEINEQIKDNS